MQSLGFLRESLFYFQAGVRLDQEHPLSAVTVLVYNPGRPVHPVRLGPLPAVDCTLLPTHSLNGSTNMPNPVMRCQRALLLLFVLILGLLPQDDVRAADGGQRAPLRVVMDNTYPPYTFLDSAGQIQGILADQWRLWQEKTGIPVEIVAMDWKDALAGMKAGRFDVIDTAFYTEERAGWLEYGKAYARIEVTAFFNNEISGIVDVDSLQGFAVAVKEGDAAIDLLRSHGVNNLLLYKGYEEMVQAAKDRKVNVFVIDKPPALYFLHKYGLQQQYRVSRPFHTGEFHRAVAKGNTPLLLELEAGFARISPQELEEIERKWYGAPLLNLGSAREVLLGAAILLGLIVGLFYWNRTLRQAVHKRTADLESSQEDLRQSEARYRGLVENANSIILRMDSMGRIAFLNEFAQEFFGYRLEEVIGESVIGVIVPEEDSAGRNLRDMIADIGRQPDLYITNENENMRRDGTRVWISWTNRPLYNAEGEVREILCVGNDISDLKRTEEALRRERERLELVIKGSQLGAWEWNVQTNASVFHPIWASLLGYTIEELEPQSNETWVQLVHPDDRDRAIAVLARYIEGKTAEYDNEFRMRHKDGHWVWILSRGRILNRDTEGRPLLMFGTHTDISGMKRAEEELQATGRLLSLFIKHSPIYAYVKEVRPNESRNLFASDNFQEMIGVSADEMIGKSMRELFPPEFADKITADDWLVVSQGLIVHQEEELGGRHYTTIKFPIQLEERHLLAGYTIDITERKRAEEELRRRENQLQKILEILPIGLWFADREGNLLRGNPMGVTIWGADPRVSIAEYGIFKAWRLPSRTPVAADDWALVRTIREGATIVDELLEIETFDGRRKTILNYSTPVFDDAGNLDGAIVVNLDVSERQALEHQLIQAQKMDSIGRLAGGVAHDFNNMLSVILGHAELAMQMLDQDHPLHGRLHNIHEAASRSAALTQQLLAFARKQTVAPRVLDLNETVAGMLNMLKRLIGENIDLIWKPSADAGLVLIDPTQVDQILVNLFVNARDAIGDTGKVTIETGAAAFDVAYCARHTGFLPGEYVLLAVSDNGCGMDAETQASLFEPFFTTKQMGQGTGLGLATVYGIVRQNDGFINVYSEPDQGTTFRIYLPRHGAASERATVSLAPSSALGGQETILLVEDEPMILELTVAMLESLGYTVLPAGTPGQAIRLAQEHAGPIHLLMTDVVMPEMNGRDLARNLTLLYPDIRRLFMSGYTANVIAHHGVLDEDVHFIQKPFSLQALAAMVRQALDDQRF